MAAQPPPPCWVCLDDGADESGERPQPTGCACRGGATTHAHVGCLARFAQEQVETWWKCPTCEQYWSGPMMLALQQGRHELAAGLPEAHSERMSAALNLVGTLAGAGQYEEALRLGRENLATIRRAVGPEHPATLTAMQTLAATHAESGDPEEAAMPTTRSFCSWDGADRPQKQARGGVAMPNSRYLLC